MNVDSNGNQLIKVANVLAQNAEIGCDTAMQYFVLFAVIRKCGTYGDDRKEFKARLSVDNIREISKVRKSSKDGRFAERLGKIMSAILKRNYVRFPSGVFYDGEPMPRYHTIYSEINPVEEYGVTYYEFVLNPKMAKYIHGLKGDFLSFVPPKAMKSKNSIRWYIYAKSHFNKKASAHNGSNGVILVSGLNAEKQMLGLSGKWKKFSVYRRDVVEPRIKAINRLGDLHISMEGYIKAGNKVTGIKYRIKSAAISVEQPVKKNKVLNPPEVDLMDLEKLNFTADRAYQILREKGLFETVAYGVVAKLPSLNFKGYEDIYVLRLWKIFSEKANSPNAAVFASWLKKGFVENHLGALNDYVADSKKAIEQKQRDARREIATCTKSEYLEIKKGRSVNKKVVGPNASFGASKKLARKMSITNK